MFEMPSDKKKSRIPVGTQFSPDLVSLPAFVQMAVEHSGDLGALREAVVQAPVRIKAYSRHPTRRMRGLPLEAAVQYGLLTEEAYEATDLTRELADLDETEIYEAFARHILLNLGGLRVVEAAQEMELDRRKITGDTLAQYLTSQGFRVTVHNTAINTLRMWLAKAGLFPLSGRGKDAWIPDPATKEKLVGMTDEAIAAFASFTPEQIAFAKALCQLEPEDWIPAADVRDLAEAIFGVRFGRASLPNEVLKPLADSGLIEFQTGGTRSGKTSQLRLTEEFRTDVLEPFLRATLADLNTALTAYYRTRPEDFYEALNSKDNYTKGHALEAFTIYVMRLLGLRFLG
ncbi:MAG: hypothetical protein ACE5G0_21295, partial [Rhodothermales bacterium]